MVTGKLFRWTMSSSRRGSITEAKCLKKDKFIVFGLTERDGGPVKVEDQELHGYNVRKESYRSEQEALKERGWLRQPHQHRLQRQESDQDQHGAADRAEMLVAEGPFTRVFVLDENDVRGDDAIEDDELPETPSQTQPGTQPTVRFELYRGFQNI